MIGEPVQTTTTHTHTTLTLERGQTLHSTVHSLTGDNTPSTHGTTTTATMPLWDPLPLENGWESYGGGYSPAQYTRTADGVVVLSGVIRNGDTSNNIVLGHLPKGFQPTHTLIYPAPSASGGISRVDVTTDGRVILTRAATWASTWTSLDGITFLAKDVPTTRTPLNLEADWTNYGGSFAPATTATDQAGRVHLQGLVNPGTTTNGTILSWLPANRRADGNHYLPTLQGNNFSTFAFKDGISATTLTTNSWLSLHGMYHTPGAATWIAPALDNEWTRHSAARPSLEYTKDPDGLVTLRGMIKGGTVGNDTIVTTLPPGYRPTERQLYLVTSNYAPGRIDADSSGRIRVNTSQVDNTWVYLDGISFVADQ